MAESVTIARPYAEAAFRIAQEAGAQGVWSTRLQRLALIAQNGDMASVMGNPRLSAEQVAELFISLSQDSDATLGSFIRTLAENRRLALLPEISRLFELATKRSTEALREGKEKAAELIANAEKRGAQLIEEAKANAKAEADRIVAGAKAEIEQEAVRAKEQLREQVAALVVTGAEHILRREINAQAHSDILATIKQDL